MFSSTDIALGLAGSVAARWVGAAVLIFGLLGCTPGLRDEPNLEEKCEALETYCVDLPESREDLRACHDTGRRGVEEPSQRDQCFVAYDECFDDCYYLYLQRRSEQTDGG